MLDILDKRGGRVKDYLSADERTYCTTIGIVAGVISDHLDKSGKHMTKNERKYLKTALTYIQKFLPELFGRVGAKEGQRIIQTMETHEFTMMPKLTAKRKFDEQSKYVELSTEEFYDFAERLLDHNCTKCTKDAEQIEECRLRHIFFEKDLPPVVGQTDGCQYQEPKKQSRGQNK